MQTAEIPPSTPSNATYSGHGRRAEANEVASGSVLNKFSHFIVEVTDLDRSEAWYRDVLCMDPLGRDLTAEDKPHAVLRMNTGQLFILVKRDHVVPRRPGSSSIHHGLMLTYEQYRAMQEHLKALGYDISDTREQFRARGEYSLDINDPDDHRYQVQAFSDESNEILLPGVGVVDCGPASAYKPGDIKLFAEGNFFLSRLPEGFLALSRWCTHMNGKVIYQKAHWRFWCPFHGATYERSGDPILSTHGECALRINRVTFSPQGHVLVDTDQVVRRDTYHPEQAVQPPAEPVSAHM